MNQLNSQCSDPSLLEWVVIQRFTAENTVNFALGEIVVTEQTEKPPPDQKLLFVQKKNGLEKAWIPDDFLRPKKKEKVTKKKGDDRFYQIDLLLKMVRLYEAFYNDAKSMALVIDFHLNVKLFIFLLSILQSICRNMKWHFPLYWKK